MKSLDLAPLGLTIGLAISAWLVPQASRAEWLVKLGKDAMTDIDTAYIAAHPTQEVPYYMSFKCWKDNSRTINISLGTGIPIKEKLKEREEVWFSIRIDSNAPKSFTLFRGELVGNLNYSASFSARELELAEFVGSVFRAKQQFALSFENIQLTFPAANIAYAMGAMRERCGLD